MGWGVGGEDVSKTLKNSCRCAGVFTEYAVDECAGSQSDRGGQSHTPGSNVLVGAADEVGAAAVVGAAVEGTGGAPVVGPGVTTAIVGAA
jgi:hypothetical protein